MPKRNNSTNAYIQYMLNFIWGRLFFPEGFKSAIIIYSGKICEVRCFKNCVCRKNPDTRFDSQGLVVSQGLAPL